MVKEIPLTQGKVALVDDSDYPALTSHKWYAVHIAHRWYAASMIDGKQKYMHIHLLGKRDGLVIDHIDGDGLNCQRENMRFCAFAENLRNHNKSANNSSGYTGVAYDANRKGQKKWTYRIRANGRVYAGYKMTCEEAVRARDELAKKHHGEFARCTAEQVVEQHVAREGREEYKA